MAKTLSVRVSEDVKAHLIQRGMTREGLGGLMLTPQGQIWLAMGRSRDRRQEADQAPQSDRSCAGLALRPWGGRASQRAPSGDYRIWLEPRFVDRLVAARGPGESYSDVILRVAKA